MVIFKHGIIIAILISILAISVKFFTWHGRSSLDNPVISVPDNYSHLRSLRIEFSEAISENRLNDPKNWLKPMSTDLKTWHDSHSAQYIDDMLWGTYIPSLYFGFRTRTAPVMLAGGLLWGASESTLRYKALEQDNIERYGWDMHDGKMFGTQTIIDNQNAVNITTSMVKPSALKLEKVYEKHIPFAVRIKVISARSQDLMTYLYFGVDTDGAEDDLLVNNTEKYGIRVVEQKALGALQWTAEVNEFSVDFWCYDVNELPVPCECKITSRMSVNNAKQHVHQMHIMQHTDNNLIAGNMLVLKIVTNKSFYIDMVVRKNSHPNSPYLITEDANPRPDCSSSNPENLSSNQTSPNSSSEDFILDAVSSYSSPEDLSRWLTEGTESFGRKFFEKFQVIDTLVGMAALSNVLGSIGYFHGKSIIKSTTNFEGFFTRLFTGVPSRSFFPRGFLWDEGFHQLVVVQWDEQITRDVLGHWLSTMHACTPLKNNSHDGRISGGFIPREQILGDTSKSRVPDEFIPQAVNVANPPSLFLVIRYMLNRVNKDNECAVTRRSFLASIMPLLNEWVTWLFVTQWSNIDLNTLSSVDPLVDIGGFQWKGRIPEEDKLNPTIMASGLDDYPRNSHPSSNDIHMDGLCWLIFACKVMSDLVDELAPFFPDEFRKIKFMPYKQITAELTELLDAKHWNNTVNAYLDYGLHSSNGAIVKEGLLKCQANNGKTKNVPISLKDLQMRVYSCPKEYPRALYPYGDGLGGFLIRERWRGDLPKMQHIERLGYVSIFPFLLQLLEPNSSRIGSILNLMENPKHLWSEFGLRSLSYSDTFYKRGNNPGDEPYWRGYIWVNINYLACAALHHYAKIAGPFQQKSEYLYIKLRKNILETVLREFHRTGYFWEQYDDATGRGLRSHPFNGWTSLVLNIMTERYY